MRGNTDSKAIRKTPQILGLVVKDILTLTVILFRMFRKLEERWNMVWSIDLRDENNSIKNYFGWD